ncbi:fork head domain-containing protein [Radiomyces spectabilis]|uniref:fork head domain-containing protein n=1 Tax=Radiomyces spectabilis TaxID=64574 RepID=UPI00221E4312|nr:fork head domain-containing protein [Radiomyces spectabilis]KAI8384816.1 fork head domain-containing protein [Radiomyces spectabilis]
MTMTPSSISSYISTDTTSFSNQLLCQGIHHTHFEHARTSKPWRATTEEKITRKRRRSPFSYSSLIAQAILSSENERLTLRAIYQWIMDMYPGLYNGSDTGWQNTIRHNLSLNKCFKKIPRVEEDGMIKGKGGYWTVDPEYMDEFRNGALERAHAANRSKRQIKQDPSISSGVHCIFCPPKLFQCRPASRCPTRIQDPPQHQLKPILPQPSPALHKMQIHNILN